MIFIIKNKKAGLNMKNKRALKKINNKESLALERLVIVLVICLVFAMFFVIAESKF